MLKYITQKNGEDSCCMAIVIQIRHLMRKKKLLIIATFTTSQRDGKDSITNGVNYFIKENNIMGSTDLRLQIFLAFQVRRDMMDAAKKLPG